MCQVGARVASCLELRLEGQTIDADVKGNKAFVTEVMEQLIWLGAALRRNPVSLDSLCYSLPSLTYAGMTEWESIIAEDPVHSFRVQYTTGDFDGGSLMYGQCWHQLFRNAVVVPGYPIPSRARDDELGLGLEITIPMMAKLARAQYLNIFHGTPMIKGFSTLLYPTEQTHTSTTWHLLSNASGEHISFAAGLSCFAPTFDIDEIVKDGRRHFLGWCRDARSYTGELQSGWVTGLHVIKLAD